MPAVEPLLSDYLAQAEVKGRTVKTLLTIGTHGTAGSITIKSDNPGVVPYWAAGPSGGLDSGANFPSLTYTSGSVIGLQVNDGTLSTQATLGYRGGKFDFKTAYSGGVVSLTAITDTPCGASSKGVSTSKNGCVALTLTGITLNATATTQYLYCELEFWAD